MPRGSSLRHLSAALNLILLTAAYAALFSQDHPSPSYRAAMIGGAIVVLVAALLTVRTNLRRQWLARPRSAGARMALAIVPWLAVAALVFAKGLWWTQRPMALRFFALYSLANWSFAWCLDPANARPAVWADSARRACVLVALVLIALGLQGAAFGFTTFGCAVSLIIAALAALVAGVASFGNRAACIRMFVATAAMFLGVAATEAVVRVTHLGQTLREVDSRDYARHFYSLTPPRTVFINPPKTLDEFAPALIEINSAGIRGPELADTSTDVLLIGDSMIEARQLPWQETLGPRLQQALRARGSTLRVVAHGMRGWSPLLEWNWYLKVGRTLHPRTVMLFFFWNDLWPAGDEASTFRARLGPDGRPESFDVPVDPNWLWYKHVRALRLTAEAWQQLTFKGLQHAFVTVAARGKSTGPLDDAAADTLARSLTETPLTRDQLAAITTTPDSGLDPALQSLTKGNFWSSFRAVDLWSDAQRRAAATTEKELQRFAEDVKADGGRLVIVYVPNPLQIAPKECSVGRLFDRVDTGVVLPPESGIQAWLHGVGGRAGIEVIDPSAPMRAAEPPPSQGAAPLYLRADCHWSPRGHQFMADYLAQWFLHAA